MCLPWKPGRNRPAPRARLIFSPMATANSPRQSTWPSTPPATALARARSVIRCWSTTVSSKSSTWRTRRASARSPAARLCWRSCRIPDAILRWPGIAVQRTACFRTPMSRPFVFLLFRLHRSGRAGARSDDPFAGKLIGAFVLRVTGVTLHPVPMHLVMSERFVEALPEVDVFHRFFIRRAPAVFLRAVDPRGDAAPDIFTVGMKIDHARSFERFQSRNRGHQLHAIVGGVRFATFEFFFVIAESQYRSPATGTRVSGAGAVSIDGDALLAHAYFPSRMIVSKNRLPTSGIMRRDHSPARFSPSGESAACGNIPADLSA